MVIISKTTLSDYSKNYPLANEALNRWYDTTRKADWNNFVAVKKDFNSVDAVGNDRYVFNIKGNEYRLIVLMLLSTRTVFILWFGSHKEYDVLNKTIGSNNVQHKR